MGGKVKVKTIAEILGKKPEEMYPYFGFTYNGEDEEEWLCNIDMNDFGNQD